VPDEPDMTTVPEPPWVPDGATEPLAPTPLDPPLGAVTPAVWPAPELDPETLPMVPDMLVPLLAVDGLLPHPERIEPARTRLHNEKRLRFMFR
jgi:hypothetical protein